jgi:hypothetical protein
MESVVSEYTVRSGEFILEFEGCYIYLGMSSGLRSCGTFKFNFLILRKIYVGTDEAEGGMMRIFESVLRVWSPFLLFWICKQRG